MRLEVAMHVTAQYGRSEIGFDVPEGHAVEIIRAAEPASADCRSETEAVLAAAMRGSGRTADAAQARDGARMACEDRRVLVLAPDGTRDQPHGDMFAALAPLLRSAREIRLLLATGTHRPDMPDNRRILDELRARAVDLGVPLSDVEAHDCRRPNFFDAGTTPRGNAVLLNRRVAEADAILILSDMKPHYFAGYSNATKFLLPATAAFESIERNHALALDGRSVACRHPLHDDPARRANPVAEDQLDAARLVTAGTPTFALATIGDGDAVEWATFGRLEDAVRRGIRAVDERLVRTPARRYRRAVIGCGGYPNDETLYIAQRSLELTQAALADGAEVLWLAECANGIASSGATERSFFAPLQGDPSCYVASVERRYVMFSHKTVRFVRLMARLSAIHVVSALPVGTFPAGCMRRCDDPQAVVERWMREGEPILLVDGANRLALSG
jgi:hypothetical protein